MGGHDLTTKSKNPPGEASEFERTYEPLCAGRPGSSLLEDHAARARHRRQSRREFDALSGAKCPNAGPFLPERAVQTRAWCDATYPSLLSFLPDFIMPALTA